MHSPYFWLWIAPIALGCIGLTFLALATIEGRKRRVVSRLQRASSGVGQNTQASNARPGSFWDYGIRHVRRLAQVTSERFSIMGGSEAETSAELLLTAGIRGRDAQVVYAFVKTVLPIAALALGVVWVVFVGTPASSTLGSFILVVGFGLLISKLPDYYLTYRRNQRLDSIRRHFPDMLELLVIASEAGLGPQKAISRIAWELQDSQPLLALELSELVSELSMTGNRHQAFSNFYARIPLHEISIFAQTLSQGERYGTPFATAMRTLLRDQRAYRMLRFEEKAARLPALMTVPLIFCIMPAVFIVLVGPAFLNIMDNILRAQ